ncbi:hypothetical protein BZG36_04964 [Bifiguratus adelaidae]|uniref:Major facilitator superfamily (MFS) profile domain-containing protein n=1 Tax=Bifiguratus adelaidae TaxID=1938954 RepID=A0A261XUN2_9FUNG|nr:hypothetical protein BZG36_04964 [Bifiguratus adelaidae]
MVKVDRGIIQMWGLCAVAIVNSATNGYDGSMMNSLQTSTQFDGYFNHVVTDNSQAGTLGLINAIMSIGSLVGVFFAPPASDRLGRKWAIIIGSVIMIIGVALQTGATVIGMFIAARFLIGFGLAITSNAAPTLVTELAHPDQRGVITGLYNTMWYLGSIIAAWTTFGTINIQNTWAWRIPSLLQMLPSLLQVVAVGFMPESPRWLIAQGQVDKAHAILTKLHGNGDPNDPIVQLEMKEIEEAIRLEREVSKKSYMELIRTPGNRYRMFLIICVGFFSQWSGNGLVSYYLTLILKSIGIIDPTTQNLINGILQIFNLICAVSAALVVEKLGRRKLFIISTAGAMVAFWLQTIFTALFHEGGGTSKSLGQASVAMIFLFYGFYDLAWTPLTVLYPVEILPFTIRAKGMAISALAIDLALFFNQYVNPVALTNAGWKYYIFYCIWLAIELAVVLKWFPETKGRTLEELAEVFDKDAASQTIREMREMRERIAMGDTEAGLKVEEYGLEGDHRNVETKVLGDQKI